MSSTKWRPLTAQEVDEVAESFPPTVPVFCIDGVVVEADTKAVLRLLPFDVEPTAGQSVMNAALSGQDVPFLSAMSSGQFLYTVPSAKVLRNINKETANYVATALGGEEIFGPDQDGILRGR